MAHGCSVRRAILSERAKSEERRAKDLIPNPETRCQGRSTNSQGETYTLEYCGKEEGHVWKRVELSGMKED